MTRARILLLLTVAAMLLSLAGCYTVLRHPTGSEVTAAGGYASYDGYRSCADCHADASYYHPYYRYGSSHYRWNGYYGSPWWYDDWWWYGDTDDYDGYEGEPGPQPETGARHLWGSGGWPTKGWGFGSSPAPEEGPRTPPPPATQPGSSQPSTGQKQEEPKKPDTDDDDDSGDDGGLWKERKKGF